MRLRLLPAYILCCAALATLSGCFLTDALPNPTKKKGGTNGGTEEPPPKKVDTLAPKKLPPDRLVRRLALDLSGRLPPAGDVAWLEEDPTRFASLVDAYIAGADAARSIAAMHGRIWRLSPGDLPDLDDFIDAGDTGLATTLTASMRRRIVEEPLLHLRYVLETRQPFSKAFSDGFTIMHSDAFGLWGLTSGGNPWPGEPFHFTSYTDGRPAAGIVASNGLLAAFPGRGDVTPRHRTSQLWQALSCVTMEQTAAHLFYDLSDAELETDYATLATQRKPCAGCHGQFEQPAAAFKGLGLATDFADWSVYQAPSGATDGFYAGQPFDDLSELAGFVGSDPRTHRCEVTRLASTLFQRPLGRPDAASAAVALNAFNQQGEDLFAATRSLVLDPEYSFDAVDGSVKGEIYVKNSSGVRVISAAQWQTLLVDLSPATADVEIPADLTPGIGELPLTSDFAIPDSVYWQSLDRVARQAATAIIATELADGTIAATRRVLTEIPDGSGAKATAANVTKQIKVTWRRLTGSVLADSDPQLDAFVKLFDKAKAADDSDDGIRAAWRMMLIAMLTHPSFVTY